MKLNLQFLQKLQSLIVLDKANVLSPLTEALSAHIDMVLSDNGTLVGANTAATSALGAHFLLRMCIE
jgi:hypothetical protein